MNSTAQPSVIRSTHRQTTVYQSREGLTFAKVIDDGIGYHVRFFYCPGESDMTSYAIGDHAHAAALAHAEAMA